MPLNVNAKITEGIDLHLLAEPEAKGVKPTVPLGSVSLPPLSVTVMPNETDSVKQVRVRLQPRRRPRLGIARGDWQDSAALWTGRAAVDGPVASDADAIVGADAARRGAQQGESKE